MVETPAPGIIGAFSLVTPFFLLVVVEARAASSSPSHLAVHLCSRSLWICNFRILLSLRFHSLWICNLRILLSLRFKGVDYFGCGYVVLWFLCC
jgi:hypothetical protein